MTWYGLILLINFLVSDAFCDAISFIMKSKCLQNFQH